MPRTAKFNQYRDKLHTLRAHLDAHGSPVANAPADTADLVDRATQQTDVEVTIGLAKHDVALRKELDDALERIKAGTFGTCQNCQTVIAARRLDAIPYARYCVRCERQVEQAGTASVEPAP